MKCPLCNAPTEIKDTRNHKDKSVIRKRVCFNGHAFKTQEKPAPKKEAA
jgi:transcriptional regulator NrdR family protein